MSTRSTSEALSERLGPIPGIERVRSGSPVRVVLKAPLHSANVPVAAGALARRGLSLRRARDVMDQVFDHGAEVTLLPMVEDVGQLVADLAAAGVTAGIIGDDVAPDLKATR